jgi:hypothetical protein
VFKNLGGGNRLKTLWTINDSIKCAKAMKNTKPAYYFVLTVASFLHYYIIYILFYKLMPLYAARASSICMVLIRVANLVVFWSFMLTSGPNMTHQ